MEQYKELPIQAFTSVLLWREWLEQHHQDTLGIWLKFAKKGTGATTLSYEEARDTAIAYGWIDGLLNAYDETYYLIRFTPRKAKSGWSKVNRRVAEALISSGAMHPAGLRHVEAAKQDGRWDLAYDSQSTMEIPADFQQALEANPAAQAYFITLSSANRYSFLYRIQTAKSPALRLVRIKKYITMLEAGENFHS